MNLNKSLVVLIFTVVSVKLIISPWATGDFETAVGQVVNYLCDAILLFVSIIGISQCIKKFMFPYVAAVFSGITYLASTILYRNESIIDLFASHFKIYIPFMIYPILLRCYIEHRSFYINSVKKICFFILFCIIFGLLFFPDSNNRSEVWWPSYFGGLHTTSYVALMLLFLAYGLYINNEIDKKYFILLFVSISVCIYFGWGVRTAILSLLVLVLGLFSMKYYLFGRPVFHYVAVFIPAFALLIIPFLGFSESLDTFTSGRISMYIEKYNQLMSNNIFQWFFGNGFGSDLIETDIWWWAAKGAHSDFITMLVEGGVIYVMIFGWVIFKFFSLCGCQARIIICAALITSLISNGILVRPIAGYIMVISLVMVARLNNKSIA